MIEVTAEEVVQAFKDRYPTEFELCVTAHPEHQDAATVGC